jgi:hypothetical protein
VYSNFLKEVEMSKFQTLLSKRTLMVGLLAASSVLASSSFAMGGNADARAGCATRQGEHAQAHKETFRAKRLATLKEKLQLQAGQATAWQEFTQATSKPRMTTEARQAMREAFKNLPTPERLDMMLSRMEQRRTHMAERVESVKKFYAQLTPAQQSVFDAAAMTGRHGASGKPGHRQGARHQQS